MIKLAETPQEIQRTFAVMKELRTDLDEAGYLAAVSRMSAAHGFRLAYMTSTDDSDRIVAVAGFRFSESLAWGSYLYVDDLVTSSGQRSHGYGKALYRWLVDLARRSNCKAVHLDSGVQRFGAHKFYLREGMNIVFHHFRQDL